MYLVSIASATQGYYHKVEISDDTFSWTLDGGGNIQVSAEPSDVYTPYMFANFTLLGKELSYDVDRSEVGCSCNSAM